MNDAPVEAAVVVAEEAAVVGDAARGRELVVVTLEGVNGAVEAHPTAGEVTLEAELQDDRRVRDPEDLGLDAVFEYLVS